MTSCGSMAIARGATETPGWASWGNQVGKFAGQESNLPTGPFSEAAFHGGPLDGGPARNPATEMV
jgi:hypothetical protein